MKPALSLFAAAIASLLLGWVVPLLIPNISYWAQVALFVTASLLLIWASVLAYTRKPSKVRAADISVVMGDRNKIGRIGHSKHGR
jgi:membrane protein implicated in regulation of membrane protease activity